MDIHTTSIEDVKLITPKKFGDDRGFFSETFKANNIDQVIFNQDNHAFSASKGVLRGLHFQYGQNVQAKLLRVVRGAILDVAVDIRHGSPTFGQYIAEELSADNWAQLLVPHGFAHAYCTLTEDTEVLYKVDGYYDPDHEGSVLWSDPDININWPVNDETVQLSDKDKVAPLLKENPIYFKYEKGAGPFNCICLDTPE